MKIVPALAAAALAAVLCLPARAASVFDHPASAAQLERDLAPVAATLRQAQTLRGSYIQHKTLQEVPKPLVAEGTFLFVRDAGIVWRTVKPFASELVITGREIVSRDAGGSALRLGAEQQPGIRTVAGLFFAVFALDFAALEPLFELYSRGTAAGWELGLKPRQAAGAIREVRVSGRAHVERVVLHDASGDTTDIGLRDTVAGTTAPSSADLAVFPN